MDGAELRMDEKSCSIIASTVKLLSRVDKRRDYPQLSETDLESYTMYAGFKMSFGVTAESGRYGSLVAELLISSILINPWLIVSLLKGRIVASVAGKIVTMSTVLGNRTQVMTRFFHHEIIKRTSWDDSFKINPTSPDQRVVFWVC